MVCLNGLRKVFIDGFCFLNYNLVRIMFFFIIWILYGNLLMVIKIGYIKVLLFLKIEVLLVLKIKEMFFG